MNIFGEEIKLLGHEKSLPITLSDDGHTSRLMFGDNLLLKTEGILKIFPQKIAISPDGQTGACLIYERVAIKNIDLVPKISSEEKKYVGLQLFRLKSGVWIADPVRIWVTLPQNYRWISNLGSIDDGGNRILANFGKIYLHNQRKVVVEEWETWTSGGKLLASGLPSPSP